MIEVPEVKPYRLDDPAQGFGLPPCVVAGEGLAGFV